MQLNFHTSYFTPFVAAIRFGYAECKCIHLCSKYIVQGFCSIFAAVFFLEYWKRKEITLAYQWDVLGFEEEEVRHIRIHEISSRNRNEIVVNNWTSRLLYTRNTPSRFKMADS